MLDDEEYSKDSAATDLQKPKVPPEGMKRFIVHHSHTHTHTLSLSLPSSAVNVL
jgi:hypothetical protein